MNEMNSHLNIFEQELPREELFHYTSIDGLNGVVAGKTLWASNIEFLNDSSEFQYGEKVLKEIIKARKRSVKGDCREFFNQLEMFPKFFEANDVFLVSLSEVGDLLSQWRGYSPPGRGYCIGFNPQALSQAAWSLDQMQLVKCVYSEKDQKNLARQVLDACIEKWVSRVKGVEGESGSRVSDTSALILWKVYFTFIAAAIKHPAFSEEREWRLLGVCRDRDKMHFRAGSSSLIRYIKLTWGGNTQAHKVQPIRSVTIGPCPDPDLTKKSVRQLLDASGTEGAQVKVSEIPFRAW